MQWKKRKNAEKSVFVKLDLQRDLLKILTLVRILVRLTRKMTFCEKGVETNFLRRIAFKFKWRILLNENMFKNGGPIRHANPVRFFLNMIKRLNFD